MHAFLHIFFLRESTKKEITTYLGNTFVLFTYSILKAPQFRIATYTFFIFFLKENLSLEIHISNQGPRKCGGREGLGLR